MTNATDPGVSSPAHPASVRGSAILGIIAFALAVAAVLAALGSVSELSLIAGVIGLSLGLVAVITRRGRPWGIAATAIVGALLVLTLAAGFLNTSLNFRQQAFLDRAADVHPPAGMVIAEVPMGIGWCGYFQLVCDEAQVLWSYAPTDDADDLCDPFLEWAGEQGAESVFVVSDAAWETWYVAEAAPGLEQLAIDSAEAAEACAEITGNPRGPSDGIDQAMNLIALGPVPGDDDAVFVGRMTEPKSLPDGSFIDSPDADFMIVGSYHGR